MTQTRIESFGSATDVPHIQAALTVTASGTQAANSPRNAERSLIAKNTILSELSDIEVSYQESVCGELRSCSLSDFFDWIEDGRYRHQVDAIRTLYSLVLEETADEKAAKKAVSELKKALPAITPSGLFEGARKRENLRKYSKHICYDVDGCKPGAIMDALPNCPHVRVGFISPTSTGIKLFVPVDAANDGSDHSALWQAGKVMVKKFLGVSVDESRKDVTGLCFISAGKAYHNESAIPGALLSWSTVRGIALFSLH